MTAQPGREASEPAARFTTVGAWVKAARDGLQLKLEPGPLADLRSHALRGPAR